MRRRLWFILAVFPFVCLPFRAQTSSSQHTPQSGQAPTTFRASSRLVLVDVVVTGRDSRFIQNLKATDFTILEDGKPQSISGFTSHTGTGGSPMPRHVPLPPNQYTNYNAPAPDHPITIVLLDMLNTVIQDRAYARQQMIKFLRSLPPGQPVALFTLGGHLRMLQGFTESSDALVAAAKALLDKNESARLNTSEEDLENAESMDAEFAAMMSIGGLQAAPTHLAEALENEQAYQIDVRVQTTLESLRMLAQSVAGYSGRKNLIWLAGDFPVGFSPDLDHNPFAPNHALYQDEVHEASSALSSSQVAVYPIDIRGLESSSMDVTLRSAPSGEQIGRRVDAQWNTQFSMKDIASQTGGEAFYNSNDLADAMRRSLDEGSNYYTLAYVPQNRDWNGQYRKIQVRVAVDGAKTRHRSGYYALPEKPLDADSADRLLADAMQRTVPESTRLLMKVQVLPPSAERKAVSIDFAVVATDLDFADGPDQRKNALVEFSAVALDKDWKEAGLASKTVDASLRPETYQRVLRGGFPGHLDLEVKPGRYILRLGVMDRHNQKIGTLDVPLDARAESASK